MTEQLYVHFIVMRTICVVYYDRLWDFSYAPNNPSTLGVPVDQSRVSQ